MGQDGQGSWAGRISTGGREPPKALDTARVLPLRALLVRFMGISWVQWSSKQWAHVPAVCTRYHGNNPVLGRLSQSRQMVTET